LFFLDFSFFFFCVIKEFDIKSEKRIQCGACFAYEVPRKGRECSRIGGFIAHFVDDELSAFESSAFKIDKQVVIVVEILDPN